MLTCEAANIVTPPPVYRMSRNRGVRWGKSRQMRPFPPPSPTKSLPFLPTALLFLGGIRKKSRKSRPSLLSRKGRKGAGFNNDVPTQKTLLFHILLDRNKIILMFRRQLSILRYSPFLLQDIFLSTEAAGGKGGESPFLRPPGKALAPSRSQGPIQSEVTVK